MLKTHQALSENSARSPLWQRMAIPPFALLFVLGHMLFLDGLFKGTAEFWEPATMTEAEAWFNDLFPFFTNFGLMLSPFVRRPGTFLRYAMVLSLACGAILTGFRLVPGMVDTVHFQVSGGAAKFPAYRDAWSYVFDYDLWAIMSLYIFVSMKKLFRLVLER